MNRIPEQYKDQLHFPCDAKAVQDHLQKALDKKLNLRVKASGHAWPPGIATGRAEDENGFDENPNALYQVPTNDTQQLNLRLDNINHVEKMTEEEAEEVGIEWNHTWKELGDKTVPGGLFRVGAGTVLGTNEIDGGNVKIEDGVLYNIDKNGYALFDIGGIYSQTMAGYLATGAAGGSTTESIELNVIAYRIVTCKKVDVTGKVKATTKWIRKEGKGLTAKEKDEFHAYATSMGLLGVTVEVIVRGIPRFAIAGYEITTKICDCEVDLFGDGGKAYKFDYQKKEKKYTICGTQVSMSEYLKTNKYTRLEWWPEKSVNAVTLWKAAKLESIPVQASSYPQEQAPPGITIDVPEKVSSFSGADKKLTYPTPYVNGFLSSADISILNNPGPGKGEVTVTEVLSSILLMIIGNLNNLSNVSFKIFSAQDGLYGESWIEEFRKQALDIFKIAIPDSNIVDNLLALASELALAIVRGVSVPLAPIINAIGDLLKKFETRVVTFLYNAFAAPVSFDGGPQQFCDIWFEGLPMDKDVNYVIIPVVFSELWFPIERCSEVMKIIEKVFSPDDNENQTLFAIEFYAGSASKSWLSASGPYPEGNIYNQKDEEGEMEQGPNVLRVDPYYFPYNSEDGINNPNDMVSNGQVFFSKKWERIREMCATQTDATTGELNPIPFKFHMGKYAGDIGSIDQYKNQYGKWDAWHKKRAEMDPNFVFTNKYWSEKLSIDNGEGDKDNRGCRCCF